MTPNKDLIRTQWGYCGKPKQWQDGFDAGLKELTEYSASLFTEEDMIQFCSEHTWWSHGKLKLDLQQFIEQRGK